MRKLATVRRIEEIRAIPDADAIEAARVGGWIVVVKKGEYKTGDLAIYCEIDSWIPHELAPFLSKGQEPRLYEGVLGERLRTVKLRGQVSQGLLLPISEEIQIAWAHTFFNFEGVRPLEEGEDITDMLGIKKWEAPIPASIAGDVVGAFPSFMPKTDQERIQNLTSEFDLWKQEDHDWEVTEKLDGTSMTVFRIDDRFGVCGRNWELKETLTNSLWRAVKNLDLQAKFNSLGRNIAVQGELIGEGIQGNRYGLRGQGFFVYDIYDITEQRYLNAFERREIVELFGVNHCPVLEIRKFRENDTVESLLSEAEAKSTLNSSEREGIVFKCVGDPSLSFKAISNKFLLKGGD